MIIESIKNELTKHGNKNTIIQIGYIKEYLQTLLLKEIYSDEKTKNLIFYGGTSLRFLFQLNRLSEDLDFIGKGFSDFGYIGKKFQTYFSSESIPVEYKVQKFRITLKFRNFLKLFDMHFGTSTDLYLKIEISDNFDFCETYETKIYPLFKYNQSLIIKSFDISTLFSTKLNAVLYRKWEKQVGTGKIRVKGRDIYDLFWYLSNNTPPHLDCIDGIGSMNELKKALGKIISNIDFREVILDIENFIEDSNMLDFIESSGKQYILEKINSM